MNNLIYIIVAAAIFIGAAGMLLFAGSDVISTTFSESQDIRTEASSDWSGFDKDKETSSEETEENDGIDSSLAIGGGKNLKINTVVKTQTLLSVRLPI